MKVLVTGAFGYIGRHLVAALLDAGHYVVGADRRLTPPDWPHSVPKLAGVMGEMDSYSFRRRLEDREHEFDACVHLAATSNLQQANANPASAFENNTIATERLADSWQVAFPGKPFIFASTAAVYGNPEHFDARSGGHLFHESYRCSPTSLYGASKRTAEMMLENLGEKEGLNWLALRFFNAAGAWPEKGLGENHHPETHLIPRVVSAIQHLERIHVYGNQWATVDGTAVRDYVHVRDICRGIMRAIDWLNWPHSEPLQLHERVFNLGARHASVQEIITLASSLLGIEPSIEVMPMRQGDVARLVADTGKARKLLGWRAEYSLVKMIQDTIDAGEKT